MRWLPSLLLAPVLALSLSVGAQPHPGAQVSLEPRPGNRLPLETEWKDEQARSVRLGALLHEPSLVMLAYFNCPMLCPRSLHALARTLRAGNLPLPVVVASIDPREDADDARRAHAEFLATAGGVSARFLTGPPAASEQLAQAAGIRYAYDAEHGEYAHPAVFLLTDGQGRIARYLPVFETTARDLRLALAEVSAGKTATLWDHALLLCYAYDPATGRYTLAVNALLRSLGVVTVACMALVFWRLRRREKP